jgi:hypothetical protein
MPFLDAHPYRSQESPVVPVFDRWELSHARSLVVPNGHSLDGRRRGPLRVCVGGTFFGADTGVFLAAARRAERRRARGARWRSFPSCDGGVSGGKAVTGHFNPTAARLPYFPTSARRSAASPTGLSASHGAGLRKALRAEPSKRKDVTQTVANAASAIASGVRSSSAMTLAESSTEGSTLRA